jgi:hypothetical protein
LTLKSDEKHRMGKIMEMSLHEFFCKMFLSFQE